MENLINEFDHIIEKWECEQESLLKRQIITEKWYQVIETLGGNNKPKGNYIITNRHFAKILDDLLNGK